MGLLLRPGVDWIYPYYRDRALCLMLGVNAARDAAPGSRRKRRSQLRRPPDAFALGPLPIGTSSASPPAPARNLCRPWAQRKPLFIMSSIRRRWRRPRRLRSANTSATKSDEIVYVSAGDGATSEGEFWESLNAACAKKLPLLYLIEDNGYAISVPVEVQTAGGSISKLVRGFPGLHVAECDGTDPLESYRGLQRRRAILPRAPRPGPRSRARDATVFALAFRRRKTLQDPRRARRRSAPRPALQILACSWFAKAFSTRKQIEDSRSRSRQEVREAADQALAAEEPQYRFDSRQRLFAGRRSHLFCLRSPAATSRRAENHGRNGCRDALRRNGCGTSASPFSAKTSPTPAAKNNLEASEREGWRLQSHRRACSANTERSRFQFAPWRKPASSAAPSAWPRAASSPSPKFSSSTTSGPP